VAGRGREVSARVGRQFRDAFADLLDQRTPFGRLALTHVLMTAGDTLLTISLAGSLFFSISPAAAKTKVLLYLVLTMAPFAVVAPLLGPLIDRSRGARRAMVVASAALRAGVCLLLATRLHSLLLFPLAFTMLVLSKLYLVTKGAIVPQLADTPPPAAPGGGEPDAAADEAVSADAAHAQMATLNARLGLLAVLAGFASSVPAIAVLKLAGAPWVLYLDVVVFAAATVAGLRLPVRAARGRDPHRDPGPAAAPDSGPQRRLPPHLAHHPEVTLALSAMSLLRGVNGFLTFLLAFDLRRRGVAVAWYGVVLAASAAGSLVGVLLVPRARRLLNEPQVLTASVWLVVAVAATAAFVGGVAVQALMAFGVWVACSAGKPAFDALIQREIPADQQGRAFARYETRLQLVWVIGSLIPVGIYLPLVAGDLVIAAAAVVGAVSYLTGRRAVRAREREA